MLVQVVIQCIISKLQSGVPLSLSHLVQLPSSPCIAAMPHNSAPRAHLRARKLAFAQLAICLNTSTQGLMLLQNASVPSSREAFTQLLHTLIAQQPELRILSKATDNSLFRDSLQGLRAKSVMQLGNIGQTGWHIGGFTSEYILSTTTTHILYTVSDMLSTSWVSIQRLGRLGSTRWRQFGLQS